MHQCSFTFQDAVASQTSNRSALFSITKDRLVGNNVVLVVLNFHNLNLPWRIWSEHFAAKCMEWRILGNSPKLIVWISTIVDIWSWVNCTNAFHKLVDFFRKGWYTSIQNINVNIIICGWFNSWSHGWFHGWFHGWLHGWFQWWFHGWFHSWIQVFLVFNCGLIMFLLKSITHCIWRVSILQGSNSVRVSFP